MAMRRRANWLWVVIFAGLAFVNYLGDDEFASGLMVGLAASELAGLYHDWHEARKVGPHRPASYRNEDWVPVDPPAQDASNGHAFDAEYDVEDEV